MKFYQKFLIAACTAMVIGGALGFLTTPGGRRTIERIITPTAMDYAHPTPHGASPTQVATVTTTAGATGAAVTHDGVVTVSHIFPANNGFEATLHLDVYAPTGAKLAWGWGNATLSTPQSFSVDVPTRLVTDGEKLRVSAYYTDKSGDFQPYTVTFTVTAHP